MPLRDGCVVRIWSLALCCSHLSQLKATGRPFDTSLSLGTVPLRHLVCLKSMSCFPNMLGSAMLGPGRSLRFDGMYGMPACINACTGSGSTYTQICVCYVHVLLRHLTPHFLQSMIHTWVIRVQMLQCLRRFPGVIQSGFAFCLPSYLPELCKKTR